MKIAIVHEMLIKLGGAEKVLQEFMQMYPQAEVFTLMYDEQKVGSVFPKQKIHCVGPAQWLFRLTGKPRASLPFMPASVRKIDLSGYDLVITSSSGFAHGVTIKKVKGESGKEKGEELFIKNPPHSTITLPLCTSTKHICYCHSPARYLWDATEEVQAELGISKDKRGSLLKIYLLGPLVKLLFWWLRRVDLRASQSPDIYIANSCEVQSRILKYYTRDSIVLWPPVETSCFISGSIPVSKRTYYVITSALTPFKKVDRAIRVMTKLGLPLKIIGDGAQRSELQKIVGNTIEFLGRISDEEKVKIYMHARGFLMPQKEDAGIAPLEAMAAGVPVFGLGKGGLLEVNIDGVTGRFFAEENDESFEAGFVKFDQEVGEGRYNDTGQIVRQACLFGEENFQIKFQEIVEGQMSQ